MGEHLVTHRLPCYALSLAPRSIYSNRYDNWSQYEPQVRPAKLAHRQLAAIWDLGRACLSSTHPHQTAQTQVVGACTRRTSNQFPEPKSNADQVSNWCHIRQSHICVRDISASWISLYLAMPRKTSSESTIMGVVVKRTCRTGPPTLRR